jgi:hypothetical protein
MQYKKMSGELATKRGCKNDSRHRTVGVHAAAALSNPLNTNIHHVGEPLNLQL